MSVLDISAPGEFIKIGDKQLELSLTMEGAEYLAKEWGGVIAALSKMDEIGKELKMDGQQVKLISDLFYACTMGQITKEESKKLLNFKNMGQIFGVIRKAVIGSTPESEGGENPQTT